MTQYPFPLTSRMGPTIVFLLCLIAKVSVPGLSADTATLIIYTDPSGAAVTVNGSPLGSSPGSFQVASGEGLVVTLERAGYRSKEVWVDALNPGETRFLDLLDDPLQPLGGGLDLQTDAGVDVFFETPEGARLVGTSDPSGKIRLSGGLLSEAFGAEGEIRLLLRKSGFRDKRVRYFFADVRGTTEAVEMEPLPARLLLRSRPSGARITLDGREIGRTPLDFEIATPGRDLDLLLSLPGHRDYQRTLPGLSPAETRNPGEIELEALPGTLRLRAVDNRGQPIPGEILAEARVFVDNELFPLTGTSIVGLGLGVSRRIVFEHPLFHPVIFSVNLASGESPERRIELAPLPASLELRMNLPASPDSLRVNEEDVLLLNNRFEVPANTPLNIVVGLRGFPDASFALPAMGPMEEGVLEVNFRVPVARVEEERRIPFEVKGIRMIWVEAGRFIPSGENPREVTLTHGFWMSETPITQAQFQALTGRNPSHRQSRMVEQTFMQGRREVVQEVRQSLVNYPVDSVSWNAANDLGIQLRQTLRQRGFEIPAGYTFRLPTEAEWLFAAYEAGSGLPLALLNDPSSAEDMPRNRLGLRGLPGVVDEWIADAWQPVRFLAGNNPYVGDESAHRVVLGPPSSSDERVSRKSAHRPSETIGFRAVLAPALDYLPFLMPEMGLPRATEPRLADGSPLANGPFAPSQLDAPGLRILDEPRLRRHFSGGEVRELADRTFHVRTHLGKNGRVKDARVVEVIPALGPGSDLSAKMEAYLKNWIYEAPQKDGQPVEVLFLQIISF